MSPSRSYHEAFIQLAEVYLEDSWVLDITKNDDLVLFEMDFVLTERHNYFHPPKSGEQYCYRKGSLFFSSFSSAVLKLSNEKPSIDANGEIDLGNIHSFTAVNRKVSLEGDWGTLKVDRPKVTVKFDSEEPAL